MKFGSKQLEGITGRIGFFSEASISYFKSQNVKLNLSSDLFLNFMSFLKRYKDLSCEDKHIFNGPDLASLTVVRLFLIVHRQTRKLD